MKNKNMLNLSFHNKSSFFAILLMSFGIPFNIAMSSKNYTKWNNSNSLLSLIYGLCLIAVPSYFLAIELKGKYNELTQKRTLLISLGATDASIKKTWFKTIVLCSVCFYASSAIPLFIISNTDIDILYIFISLIILSLVAIKSYTKPCSGIMIFSGFIIFFLIILIAYYIKDLLYDFWYSDIISTINLAEVTSKLNLIDKFVSFIDKYQYALMLILSIPTSWYYYKNYKQLKSTINNI